MPNGNNKNNGKKEIELLPVELRRPEERKKKTEREEVKFFIPPAEEKPKGPAFAGKIFSRGGEPAGEIRRETEMQKAQAAEEAKLAVFKMQKETKHPSIAAVPPAPLPPKPLPPKPQVVPQKTEPVQKPTAEVRPKFAPPAKTRLSSPAAPRPLKRMLGITLMPEERVGGEEARKPKRGLVLVVIGVVMAIILGGLYFGLKLSEGQVSTELKKAESDLATVNQKIKDVEGQKNQAQTLQKQIKAADKLLAEHIYWTKFFSFLEKNTVTDVYFINIVGGSDGQINLSGVAKSYNALARQIVAFREDEGTDSLSVASASASVDPTGKVAEVNFDAKLKLKPEVFLK